MDDHNNKIVVRRIRDIAKMYGWAEIDHQEIISMISFLKGESRINVYYAREWRMTIATTINHPTGRKQLFRKFIRMPELAEIFRNPRNHTGRGYYRKHGKQKMAKPAAQTMPEVQPDTAGISGPEYSF
jgi:hypothetical protein